MPACTPVAAWKESNHSSRFCVLLTCCRSTLKERCITYTSHPKGKLRQNTWATFLKSRSIKWRASWVLTSRQVRCGPLKTARWQCCLLVTKTPLMMSQQLQTGQKRCVTDECCANYSASIPVWLSHPVTLVPQSRCHCIRNVCVGLGMFSLSGLNRKASIFPDVIACSVRVPKAVFLYHPVTNFLW